MLQNWRFWLNRAARHYGFTLQLYTQGSADLTGLFSMGMNCNLGVALMRDGCLKLNDVGPCLPG
jgi:hypothetical protein